MFDGVPLGQLGIEGINTNDALSLAVLAAVTFTPDLPPTDTNPEPVPTRWIPHRCSQAVVIGCKGGSSIRALYGIFELTGVTDPDWRTLESIRANDMAINTLFKRTCPGDPEYDSWVKSLKPNHWKYIQEGKRAGGRTTMHSRSSYHHCPHLHLLPSPPLDAVIPYLLKSATWTDDLTPLLSTTGYCLKAVEMLAQQVGVPSTKRKTFVACVRNHPSAEEHLTR